jgi:hypothetical protein
VDCHDGNNGDAATDAIYTSNDDEEDSKVDDL